jgi:HlyD family secretion protein
MEIVENTALVPAGQPRGKKMVRNTLIIFVLALILLTLFSNTLLNYSLPQVTLEKGAAGALQQTIDGSGVADAVETQEQPVDVNWQVADVKVKVGDTVKAGQVLVTFKTKDAQNSLLDEKARYQKQQISFTKQQNNYIDAVNSGTDDKQLQSMQLDIQSSQLDLQIEERKLAQMEQQLNDFTELKAGFDGIVTEVNAVTHLAVQSGKSAVTIANNTKGVIVKANIDPTKAGYVKVNDVVDLTFSDLNNARIKGKLTEINSVKVNNVDKKELVFTVVDNRLKGGEAATFSVVKKLAPSRMLLSNTSVRTDDTSKFVLLLKQKKGALGNEYYVQRANVTVGDSDDSKISIEGGLSQQDQVIVSSNKSVADGDHVVIAN